MAGEQQDQSLLLKLGECVQSVRELFSWNQDEFAVRLGVSRPTLANAEKDPTKLSKTVAMAMFLVTTAELKRRKEVVQNAGEQQKKNKVETDLLTQLKRWGTSVPIWLSLGYVARAVAMPVAAGLIVGSLVAKIKSIKTSGDIKNSDLDEVIQYQESFLKIVEEKLFEFYGTLDATEFVIRLNKSSAGDNGD
jgi:hypothetical protein